MSADTTKLLIVAAIAAAVGWIAARGLPGNATERLTAIESGQEAILKELQGLRQGAPSTAQPPAGIGAAPVDLAAPPAEPLTLAGAAAMGRPDAPLTMIEFSDFQCPFCSRHVRTTFEQIKRAYVDTGKVRYVFRHNPIESLHPQAWPASRMAECASRQGKFWEFHALLFANQKQMTDADLDRYAGAAGVDVKAARACAREPAVTAKITADLEEGARIGVSGTPMFFIGTVENGKLRAMRRIIGAEPYAAFQQTFEALLSGS